MTFELLTLRQSSQAAFLVLLPNLFAHCEGHLCRARVDLQARAGGEPPGATAAVQSAPTESTPIPEYPQSPALLDSKFYSCPGGLAFD